MCQWPSPGIYFASFAVNSVVLSSGEWEKKNNEYFSIDIISWQQRSKQCIRVYVCAWYCWCCCCAVLCVNFDKSVKKKEKKWFWMEVIYNKNNSDNDSKTIDDVSDQRNKKKSYKRSFTAYRIKNYIVCATAHFVRGRVCVCEWVFGLNIPVPRNYLRQSQPVSNLKKEEEAAAEKQKSKKKRWSKKNPQFESGVQKRRRRKNKKKKIIKIEIVAYCECERVCACTRSSEHTHTQTRARLGLGINWILGFIAIEVNAVTCDDGQSSRVVRAGASCVRVRKRCPYTRRL